MGEIGRGMLILLGVHQNDSRTDADHLAVKCADLRVFEDDQGKMNRSLVDIEGGALVVSQFTLYGDCRKGRRPGFSDAAPAEKARELYEYFVLVLRGRVPLVQTGAFGAKMQVELINDGPVTFVLETDS